MKPIALCFPDASDPEACRKAYILGYRAGYKDGQCGNGDITRNDYEEDSIFCEPIEAMNISTHAYNCLVHSGYRYVRDVAKLTVVQIIHMPKMGKKTGLEIIQALKTYDITGTDWELAWLK